MSRSTFVALRRLVVLLPLLLLVGFAQPLEALSRCPGCQKLFPENHRFCPYDGKALVVLKSEELGRVEVQISPAQATIQCGSLSGKGPVWVAELPPGDHQITAETPGFQSQKMRVSLEKGQTVKLSLELEALATGKSTPTLPESLANAPAQTNGTAWNRPQGRDADMIEVRGMPYLLGSERGNPDERPMRRVELEPFWIDRHEVTCAQYQKFLEAMRRSGHRWCHPNEPPNKDHTPFHTYAWALRFSWVGGKPPADMLDHPVVLVDWFDAYAYANWAGKRLPSENEWEAAAGNGLGRDYPWGNTFGPKWCNTGDYPLRVGLYPAGASPVGVLDMAGNVWEWTATGYDVDPREARSFDGRHGSVIIRG
ncbi:MAG TPA: SUMF1/EgtB/PvdO family nonheme iron enzyme, partial [Candidatus Ozemobacteraceae bacterium]|nr:SUMF1/EgtB/PvdO family nonheme iron enzyme [Candidatus Ozemobacteraceae bacterium]